MDIVIAEVRKSEKSRGGGESSIEGAELSIGEGARAIPTVYKLTPVGDCLCNLHFRSTQTLACAFHLPAFVFVKPLGLTLIVIHAI